MGLFNDPKELKRKQDLKSLEDKRLAFAEKMQKKGYAPDNMILASTQTGGLYAISRFKGELFVISAPDFGEDGDFTLEKLADTPAAREDFFEASEGMGGMLGFGKKGAQGFYLLLTREDGSELRVPFIANINSFAEFSGNKNPLLSTKRRHGNANVVWDMQPIDKTLLHKIEARVKDYFNM